MLDSNANEAQNIMPESNYILTHDEHYVHNKS